MTDEPQGVRVPTKWEGVEDFPTAYANQMVITHVGSEFYIIFGEIQLPILLNPEVDTVPEIIKIRPVAKVAVAYDEMLKMASAISENVSKYLDKIGAGDEPGSDQDE